MESAVRQGSKYYVIKGGGIMLSVEGDRKEGVG